MATKIKVPKKKPVYNQIAAREALARKVGGTYDPKTGKIVRGGTMGRHPVKPGGPQPLPQSASYQAGMAGLAGDADAVRRRYGFDPGYQSDPFSQANVLKKHYEQARSSTNISQASRGNLYSSALRNALTQDRTGYEQNVSEARSEQEDALRGIDREKAGLEAERLDEALANPPPDISPTKKKKSGIPKINKALLKKAGVAAPSKKVIAKIRKKKGRR